MQITVTYLKQYFKNSTFVIFFLFNYSDQHYKSTNLVAQYREFQYGEILLLGSKPFASHSMPGHDFFFVIFNSRTCQSLNSVYEGPHTFQTYVCESKRSLKMYTVFSILSIILYINTFLISYIKIVY